MSDPDLTATGRVYAALLAAIAEQRLPPGTRLLEEELAAGFEVSRTVVRQALQRLAQDGVVELRHNRGAQVARPSRESAAQVFDARRVLECEIARRLAGRLDEAALATLGRIADEEAQALAAGDRAGDMPALQRLVHHLADQGVAGFVACGSTGEAAMLSPDEQAAVLGAVVGAVVTAAQATGRHRLPVLMGLSGVRPQAVVALARRLAQHTQPDGWLLTAPAYVKPPQSGIVAYFHAVAEAEPGSVPIVAYDIPARTGVRIEPATLRALAEHPRIRALKDCSGDRAAAEAVLADGRLALLGGNDDELFDQLARGAVGGIVASAHLATARFVALQQALSAGRLPEARALWQSLAPLTRALFAEPNPAPLKAMLARQGWLADVLRAPMAPAGLRTADAVAQAMARAEAL